MEVEGGSKLLVSSTKSSTATTTTTTTPTPGVKSIAEATFKGLGNLVKLLPTGTVFVYQFLLPLLSNKGHCHVANKALTFVFLVLCAFSCCFASFTDSYTGSDGKVYYGVATKSGMWCFYDTDDESKKVDLSKYKLRFGDFVHGFLALIVFAVVSLLDPYTVTCFYPSFEKEEKALLVSLPPVIGAVSSFVFMVFPSKRHGIGYPPTKAIEDLSVVKQLL